MDGAKVVEAVGNIKKIINNRLSDLNLIDFQPVRIDASKIDPSQKDFLSHLIFMCEEIPNLVKAGRLSKAMRWLGFIQGSLWAKGYCSISNLKDINRPE